MKGHSIKPAYMQKYVVMRLEFNCRLLINQDKPEYLYVFFVDVQNELQIQTFAKQTFSQYFNSSM